MAISKAQLQHIHDIMVANLHKCGYNHEEAKKIVANIEVAVTGSAAYTNLKNELAYLVESPFGYASDFLLSAFNWQGTDEPYSYWDNIHDNLRKNH